MNTDTIIIRIEGGQFAGVDFVNPTLRHGVVVADGVAQRCIELRPLVSEVDIAQAVRFVREGKSMGAWNGLSDWADITGAALCDVVKVAEPLAELCFELRHQHIGNPAALLADVQQARPQIAEARQKLTDALLALDEADAVCERAVEIIADFQAAHDGHHQQPRITIKRKEPADV